MVDSDPVTPSAEMGAFSGRSSGVWARISRLFRRRASTMEEVLERLRHFGDKWAERQAVPPHIIFLAGHCLGTLMEFGQRDVAWRLGRWLEGRQLPDGALSESRAPEPVYTATAAALRGWLACFPEITHFEYPAQKAARFLRSWVAEDGRPIPPRSRTWNYEPDNLFQEPPDLTPLLWAGRRWPDTDWTTAALRGIDHWLAHGHKHVPPQTTGALARRAFFCLEWGRRQEVLALVEKLDQLQLPSGAVPERQGQRAVHFATVGQAALVWFRLYNQQRGEAAIRFLERHLAATGGLPATIGTGSRTDEEEDPLAIKFYADATLARVRCWARTRLRDEIALDAEDARLQRAKMWAQSLPAGAQVADLGCGTGRYLRYLASWLPHLQWMGIDFLPEALERVPRGIKTIEGSLLRIPLTDHALHGVLVIDTLADALLPRQIIKEILRVLRPKGRILILEPTSKGRLLSESPWAHALGTHEVENQLRAACQDVTLQSFDIYLGAFTKRTYVAVIGTKKP